jgi:hypothetical protein
MIKLLSITSNLEIATVKKIGMRKMGMRMRVVTILVNLGLSLFYVVVFWNNFPPWSLSIVAAAATANAAAAAAATAAVAVAVAVAVAIFTVYHGPSSMIR